MYYGNRLEDTKSDMDLEPLFQFVATPIDQRSTPAEQVRSKEAYDVIKNGQMIQMDLLSAVTKKNDVH